MSRPAALRVRLMHPLLAWATALLACATALGACSANGIPRSSPAPTLSPAPTVTPEEPPRITLTRVADGLTAPIGLVAPPDDLDRTLVVDQGGTVGELTEKGLAAGPPFLDLRKQIVELKQDGDDERGLLGVAFHPAFAENRRLYVFRTAPVEEGGSHRNVLSEFRTDAEGRRVDPGTEKVLWSALQVYPSHAAGQLHVDGQGRLLVFLGDGQDPPTAQDPASPQGKVLRFDLSRPDAPPEVLASGMRHPWRLSVDEPTGQLLFSEPNFTAQFQEVNSFADGANYGWGLTVPSNCWGLTGSTPDPGCVTDPGDGKPLQPPVAEYGPELGFIVAGAHVYRGSRLAGLRDRLVVAEWGISRSGLGQGGRILVSGPVDQPPYRLQEAEISGLSSKLLWFWSLGRDSAGELYLMTMAGRAPVPGGGAVYRLESAG